MCKHHSTAGSLHNLTTIAHLTSQSGIVWVLQQIPPTLEGGEESPLSSYQNLSPSALHKPLYGFIRFHMKMLTIKIFKYYYYTKLSKRLGLPIPSYNFYTLTGMNKLFSNLGIQEIAFLNFL